MTKDMIACLRSMPLHSITPDRRKKFSNHAAVAAVLSVNYILRFYIISGSVEQMKTPQFTAVMFSKLTRFF